MSRISSKNQVTLPVEQMQKAGLEALDEVEVMAQNDGQITIRRAKGGVAGGLGIFDGLYEPGYLEQLRKGERY